jgi:mRNA interferase MazF
MRRGDLYRVFKPGGDPKQYRTFVIVSRQALIDSRFSSVVCAPVFSSGQGLSSQVAVGPDEGFKHASWIMCDNLVSLRKSDLTNDVGALGRAKLAELNRALKMALDLTQSKEASLALPQQTGNWSLTSLQQFL